MKERSAGIICEKVGGKRRLRAFPEGSCDINRATMLVNNLFYDGKTKSCSAVRASFICAIERFEDVLEIMCGDAHTVPSIPHPSDHRKDIKPMVAMIDRTDAPSRIIMESDVKSLVIGQQSSPHANV